MHSHLDSILKHRHRQTTVVACLSSSGRSVTAVASSSSVGVTTTWKALSRRQVAAPTRVGGPSCTCMVKKRSNKTKSAALQRGPPKPPMQQDGSIPPNGAPAAAKATHAKGRTANALPKLVVFDLDGCLWWPEMYMMSGPPFKRLDRDGRNVADRMGDIMRLMGASHDIMHELVTADHFRDTKVAYASRCDYPPWAEAVLKLFEASPGVSMADAAQYSEIYFGSKTKHFRALHKASGIPYREMLFFDNETRNCRDVSTLGVTCMYAPDGMTAEAWEEGLKKYAKAASKWAANGGNGPPHSSAVSGEESGDEWGGYW